MVASHDPSLRGKLLKMLPLNRLHGIETEDWEKDIIMSDGEGDEPPAVPRTHLLSSPASSGLWGVMRFEKNPDNPVSVTEKASEKGLSLFIITYVCRMFSVP